MGTFVYRLMGAVTLDRGTYEGIEADRRASYQSALVVFVASIAAGIGAASRTDAAPLRMIVFGATAFVSWIAWAAITLLIGTKILAEPQTRSDLGEMLRTLGFAAAPAWLQIFAVLTDRKMAVFVVTITWMVVAMVTALRQALDYTSTWRAAAVCALGATLIIGVILALSATIASMA